MYIFNKLTVIPKLPDNIKGLSEIVNNVWWSWNTEYLKLFKFIDADLWNEVLKNPYKFLKLVEQEKLEEASNNPDFIKEYEKVYENFKGYMNKKDTYYAKKHLDMKDKQIAYFSAEYGLDETVPLYSGGLGILSGDTLKSASDLGLPLVAIGLMYKEGYFMQHIDAYGNQISNYEKLDVKNMPILPVTDEEGNDLKVVVKMEDREVTVKVWQINVGRVKLYLLDSDVEENNEEDRKLTHRLYGGDRYMRCAQEMILGMGGIRALEKLGYNPDVYHMNEGHSAFLIIELAKKLMKEREISFDVAMEIVTAKTAFTTHTAVPAGNDIFNIDLIKKIFDGVPEELGLSMDEFLKLGMCPNAKFETGFNMGVFALKYSGIKNGVSKLHGAVSRALFTDVWPNTADDESPITHVTNGVHTTTWLAPGLKELYNKYFPAFWQDEIWKDEIWQNVYNIPNEELWDIHRAYKKKLIREIKKNVRQKMMRNGESYEEIAKTLGQISENDLLIGFARRFATYKRATIIFDDLERLTQILNDPNRPVRLIFAGKAHPADVEGQNLIRRIHEVSKMPQFKGKVILLENYNMGISRYLISGTDIWLNNPRRPLEASGTSGQKASVNGVVNFSVLDGWWAEGYTKTNGYSIGKEGKYESDEEQDRIDSIDIYEQLEGNIIPTYFEKDKNGTNNKWILIMKNSIATTGGKYSTSRMVIDYLEDIYMPLMVKSEKYFNDLQTIFEYISWKKDAYNFWDKIEIEEVTKEDQNAINAGGCIKVAINVKFGNIQKEHAKVESYVVKLNGERIEHIENVELKETKENEDGSYTYEGNICVRTGGNYAYTYRVVPKHEMAFDIANMDLAKWYTKETK